MRFDGNYCPMRFTPFSANTCKSPFYILSHLRKTVMEAQLLGPSGYFTVWKAKFMEIDALYHARPDFRRTSPATWHVNCAMKGELPPDLIQIHFWSPVCWQQFFLVEQFIFNYGSWFDLSYFRSILRKCCCCCLLSVFFTPSIPLFCNTMNQPEAAGVPTEIIAVVFQNSSLTTCSSVLPVSPTFVQVWWQLPPEQYWMLRPRHWLVGGCDVHGHAAVRRWRLRSTRKVIFFSSPFSPRTAREERTNRRTGS